MIDLGADHEGYITQVNKDHVLICVPMFDKEELQEIQDRKIVDTFIRFRDPRGITDDQRKKIFALIKDITEFVTAPIGKRNITCLTPHEEETLSSMGMLYLFDMLEADNPLYNSEEIRNSLTNMYCTFVNKRVFSLSTVDRETACDFIDWLVEFCVVHGIPCRDTLLGRACDIGRYLYACVANKRCCICGRPAQLHHWDRVGMGRNRQEIVHLGMHVQALCNGGTEVIEGNEDADIGGHHRKCHDMGQESFDKLHGIYGIELDENLCKIHNLKRG